MSLCMTRYVLDVDVRACKFAFEDAVALVEEVAAVIAVAVLAVALEVETWERSGGRWCGLLELSCKRYLVIMAASSPRLEVADDVEVAVPGPRCSSENLLVLEAPVPRGGTGGGIFPDGTRFGFGGLAALLPFSTAG